MGSGEMYTEGEMRDAVCVGGAGFFGSDGRDGAGLEPRHDLHVRFGEAPHRVSSHVRHTGQDEAVFFVDGGVQ